MSSDAAQANVNVSQAGSAATSVLIRGSAVVSASALQQLLSDAKPEGVPALRLIDCRYFLGAPEKGAAEFDAGHIPGAIYADLEKDLSSAVLPGHSGRHPLPSVEQFAAKLSAWGIRESDWVVAYDHVDGSMAAARLWWLLRYVGHVNVSVLDGGVNAWVEAGGALTTQPTTFEASHYAPRVVTGLAVEIKEVSDSVGKPNRVLLDARAPERYRGEVEPIDKRAGRIPSARSVPYATLMKQGRFESKANIATQLQQALADVPAEAAVVYCGSGVTACQLLLAAEHAGVRGLRLYPGSYSEWIADGTRAVEQG